MVIADGYYCTGRGIQQLVATHRDTPLPLSFSLPRGPWLLRRSQGNRGSHAVKWGQPSVKAPQRTHHWPGNGRLYVIWEQTSTDYQSICPSTTWWSIIISLVGADCWLDHSVLSLIPVCLYVLPPCFYWWNKRARG